MEIDEIRVHGSIEKSVREYGERLERIDREFKERTGLQDSDLPFLFMATMLQVARAIVIENLLRVERAGANNPIESSLKRVQKRIFSPFDSGGTKPFTKLHAPRHHILASSGVPYDAVRYESANHGLFKEGNHRFATLGHDPVLGILFGTSNIMTNTITCMKGIGPKIRIPVTHHVAFNPLGANPLIGTPVSTIEMLVAAGHRITSEPDIAAFSLIKHLIHIGTDLFTPKGIQLPLTNLVLDTEHVERLTEYASTGSFLKVGAQMGLAVTINWLTASLHGCALVFQDDESEYATQMHQARTQKILLYSSALSAAASNALCATARGVMGSPDLGGSAVLLRRLFSDVRFISKLKQEFVENELDRVYGER